MASFFGWRGILFGTLFQLSRGLGQVLFVFLLLPLVLREPR